MDAITVTKSVVTSVDKLNMTLTTNKITAIGNDGKVFTLSFDPTNINMVNFKQYIVALITAL